MPSSTNMHLVAPRTWQIVNNIMVVYADPEKVLSTTSSGSISWVARFYLVGGEGIQTIDSLILTREVGFSPTFPKRGSNLESATILYIYYLRTPEFPFARSLHRVYFLLACNPSCRRPKIHYSTTCNPFLRQKTGCGRKSKL